MANHNRFSDNDERLEGILEAYRKHGSIRKASSILGMSRTTFRDRLNVVMDRPDSGIVVPDLPNPEIPISELLDHLEKRFEKKQKAVDAREWMTFELPTNDPIIIPFVGDPHMGDDCHISMLRDHVNLMKHSNCYPVGMGDYINNWSGRLAQLKMPHQEISRSQEWQLVEWFFSEIPWLILIKGNHDLWSKNSTGDPLDYMYRGNAVLEDWTVKFQLKFPNETVIKVWASHSFKGVSQWNILHPEMKKARVTGGGADIFISGHRHEWGIYQGEDSENNKIYWAARARGYKWFDDYAVVHDFGKQIWGATVSAVINPKQEGPGKVVMYPDLRLAMENLDGAV